MVTAQLDNSVSDVFGIVFFSNECIAVFEPDDLPNHIITQIRTCECSGADKTTENKPESKA